MNCIRAFLNHEPNIDDNPNDFLAIFHITIKILVNDYHRHHHQHIMTHIIFLNLTTINS